MKTLVVLSLLAVAVFTSGCTAMVAAQAKGKLPLVSADKLSVSVNVVAIGGGTIAVTGAKTNPDGSLTVGTYHEEINTGSGSLKIEGENVTLPAPKK